MANKWPLPPGASTTAADAESDPAEESEGDSAVDPEDHDEVCKMFETIEKLAPSISSKHWTTDELPRLDRVSARPEATKEQREAKKVAAKAFAAELRQSVCKAERAAKAARSERVRALRAATRARSRQ